MEKASPIHVPTTQQPSVQFSKIRSFLVQPAEALEERWIQLSVLDKFILPMHLPIYFIYDCLPLDGFDDIVSKLTKSLTQVLVPFYPLAGTVDINPATGSCELHCNNHGAVFQVVYLDKEFNKTCYSKPCHELWHIAPKLNALPMPGGPPVPTMAVQVTRFKCGAVALCCSIHHYAADGYTVSLFIQAWSQLVNSKPLETVPVYDRQTLIPKEDVLEEELAAGTAPPAIIGTKPSDKTNSTSDQQSEDDDFRDSALEGYIFDPASIAQLKAKVPSATSFEVVTAFVVRHAIKAKQQQEKQLPEKDDGLAKFVLMVDFRSRLCATAYAGNAALPKAVICPRQDFLEGPLSVAIELIHEAIATSDINYFRTFVRHASRGPPAGERALAVSSCVRLPLYDAGDFGWGPPAFASAMPPVPRLVPEFLLLLPASPRYKPGSMVAYLQLQKDVLQAVHDDPEFSSFAKRYRPFQEVTEEVRR